MYEYLVLMIFGCALPVSIFWVLFFKSLMKYKKTIAIVWIVTSFMWYICDYLAFDWGVWYLGPDRHIGMWILGLPIEEWLYVILVPLSFITYTLVAKEKIGK